MSNPEAINHICEQCNTMRCKLHRFTSKWTPHTESACAIAYAVHEVFHFSTLVYLTSYGLLFILVFHVISYTTKGA